jgi:hypothetical protein
MVATIFSPRTPPAALISLTTISMPRFICSPKEAYWPVIGPTVAILISACAAPAKPRVIAAAERIPSALLRMIC